MTKERLRELAYSSDTEDKEMLFLLLIEVYNDAIDVILDSADIYSPDGDVIFTDKEHILNKKLVYGNIS